MSLDTPLPPPSETPGIMSLQRRLIIQRVQRNMYLVFYHISEFTDYVRTFKQLSKCSNFSKCNSKIFKKIGKTNTAEHPCQTLHLCDMLK